MTQKQHGNFSLFGIIKSPCKKKTQNKWIWFSQKISFNLIVFFARKFHDKKKVKQFKKKKKKKNCTQFSKENLYNRNVCLSIWKIWMLRIGITGKVWRKKHTYNCTTWSRTFFFVYLRRTVNCDSYLLCLLKEATKILNITLEMNKKKTLLCFAWIFYRNLFFMCGVVAFESSFRHFYTSILHTVNNECLQSDCIITMDSSISNTER